MKNVCAHSIVYAMIKTNGKRRLLRSAALLAAPLLIAACGPRTANSGVQGERLFSLDYGNFEKELNLFNLPWLREIHTSIAMRDGFFYIANGEAKKVLELNSYGDIISLYYNAETGLNPDVANALIRDYPFNLPEATSIDGRKYLYVTETLPADRQEYDEERKLRCNQIVLRFNDDGEFENYIGQEGPGGAPFPAIKNIYTNAADELIVVSTTNDGYMAYWFSPDGYLLYQVPVAEENVPNPFGGGQFFLNVDAVVPDPASRVLYLKTDYYAGDTDANSHLQSGIQYHGTLLHSLQVETGAYGDYIEIPPFEGTLQDGDAQVQHEIPYDFLGVTDSGCFFFSIADEAGYTVQMLYPNGRDSAKRHIDVSQDNLLYYSFNLSRQGIISALLVRRERADIVWWRTDRLAAD